MSSRTPPDTRLAPPFVVPPLLAPPFLAKGLVFDMDGLLLDSEDAWGRAEERVVADLGHPWDPALRTLLLGRGPEDAATALAAFLGEEDADEVGSRLLEAALEEFRSGLELRPGAEELVRDLAGRVPLAVATNSRRVLAEEALGGTGLLPCFSAVVCAEDVGRTKPAPDPYVTACARLGVVPRTAIGLEDSPVGMQSARDAGLWVIGCPSFPDEPTDAAHVVIGSLTELEADVLLAGPSHPES